MHKVKSKSGIKAATPKKGGFYGEQLRYFREKCRLSQDELADKLAEYCVVERTNISKYENNRRAFPSKLIVPVCEIFGITTDEFFNWDRNNDENNAGPNKKVSEGLESEFKAQKLIQGIKRAATKGFDVFIQELLKLPEIRWLLTHMSGIDQ